MFHQIWYPRWLHLILLVSWKVNVVIPSSLYEFKRLTVKKTAALIDKLYGVEYNDNKELTLAEIYNYAKVLHKTKEKEGSCMRYPNYMIVLKALMNEPGSRTVLLPSGVEIGWFNDKLHHIMYTSNGSTFDKDNCEQVWYEYDLSLNSFITECDKMTEEEIFGIVAISTLRKTLRK